ncbi:MULTISPECIES: hypothetical protein [unclassified Curtobacterium]|uniref:hypothetical protein n=1 Tax=unclassified Curtobacterium TaxID=257496 RepID=UPI00226B3205|nr:MULTISPECIES: hypothetical protein [unclassified Curtobacterium]
MSDTRNDDTSTSQQHDQHAQHTQSAQWPGSGWTQAPAPAPGQPVGPTPWYGAGAQSPRTGKPRPPWFWPVIAIAIGLAALLAGGGVGFAIGHAIATHQTHSTPQIPGQGTNRFPGQGGGTNQFPGQGGGTGTDGSTGTGGTGTDGTGS